MERISPPRGLTGVKLKCFLDLNGYRIIEFERLPQVLRNLAELLGYGVLDPEDACKLLGYANSQSLYPVIRQDEHWGVGDEKKAGMFQIWKERKELLSQKKREALRLYRLDLSSPSPLKPFALPPATNGKLAARRSGVLTILEGVLALIDEGLFEGLSNDEITALKKSDGGTILELSSRLIALSSQLMAAEGRK